MKMGRKKTTIISTFVGIISSLVGIMLTFVLRTYLLKCFNNEYVGLYTLLTQTVGILVGIDGGLSSSVLIKIHKPIAENNIEEIRRNYYLVRVIFYFRSILVLFVGSIIGFLIPRMTETIIDINETAFSMPFTLLSSKNNSE
jgi:O-antigen/teichoic acid export membrane protein